jgi:hypothetical protein
MKKSSTMKSSPQIDEVQQSEARAAAADAAAEAATQPIEPQIVEESAQPEPEKQFELDPSKMHALMVLTLKGLVLRLDHALGWERHPDDMWYDATTQIVEVLIEKYFGRVGISPETALVFQVGTHAVENLFEAKEEPPEKETPRYPSVAEEQLFHHPEVVSA